MKLVINMKKKQLSRILGAVSFYKYFFSFLMAICLFVLPVATPRSKFMESGLLDVLVRCVLWLYFVFCYWTLSVALTNQINGAGKFSWEMERNLWSFMLFAVSAIGLGLMVGLLTRWSVLIFVPWLVEEMASCIAILNGLIYAILAFSRYFWLLESK